MPTIANIIDHLETVAPPIYQEGYDNAGLIVGVPQVECTGVLTCLDSTEAVIEEAIRLGYNLVVAHHPIVFKGLKRFNGRNYVERVVMMAIKHEIAIYAIHTNLDNVYAQGVNAEIARRLSLVNTRILSPKRNARHASVYVATEEVASLRSDLAAILSEPPSAYPKVRALTRGAETQLDFLFPPNAQRAIAKRVQQAGALLVYGNGEHANPTIGSGMVGELPEAMKETEFLQHLKDCMQVGCIKYTNLLNQPVKTIALCGGAGGFLLPQAIGSGAQFFVTADYKYHEFFDADRQIVIADIGHFESEQFTINLLASLITEKFGNFAVRLTEVRTNPVNYY